MDKTFFLCRVEVNPMRLEQITDSDAAPTGGWNGALAPAKALIIITYK